MSSRRRLAAASIALAAATAITGLTATPAFADCPAVGGGSVPSGTVVNADGRQLICIGSTWVML